MTIKRIFSLLALLGVLLSGTWVAASGAFATQIVGRLDIVGSDTLAGLMMRWGERFEHRYPGAKLQLQASGSATAPPALIQGTSRIGVMSRRMTPSETNAFIERHGYAPTAIPVAVDALAIFVNRNNPLEAISLARLDAVFSDTQRCGADSGIIRWGELGLDDDWQDRRISRHGRNTASGSRAVFKREVLCGGDFRPDTNNYLGSAAVVATVARDLSGIGYSGMGYVTALVKPLTLIDAQGRHIEASPQSVANGEYPLRRLLYLYVNLPPDSHLPPLERAFFEQVLSPAGQERVAEAGFIPLPQATLDKARRTLGL